MRSQFLILFGLVYSAYSAVIQNPCDVLPTEWYDGVDEANAGFIEPIVDNVTDYIYVDTPAIYNNVTDSCGCASIIDHFSNWKTDGTWELDPVTNECHLNCDRCLVYFCIDKLAKTIGDSIFNVTFNNDNEPTCVKAVDVTTTISVIPTVVETTTVEPTHTVTIEPTSHNLTVNVDVEVIDSSKNYTYNYTYEYPNVTVPGLP